MSRANATETLVDLHPSHFQRAMPMLRRETVERIQRCDRLAHRLAKLIDYRIDRPEQAASDFDVLAYRPRFEVEVAGRHMGALIFGRALARYVDTASIAVLNREVGTSARMFGIRHSVQIVSPIVLPTIEGGAEELASAINDWGWRCLVRWRDQVSPTCQKAATLRLPAVGLPDAAPETSDAIIRHVIATFFAPANVREDEALEESGI